ncbi:MAG TPA: hypothetical protein VFB79_01510 [Candidatus Angelobacter sp.]|nr:hypothetical protein [Candidatus Angelobacter sp.]
MATSIQRLVGVTYKTDWQMKKQILSLLTKQEFYFRDRTQSSEADEEVRIDALAVRFQLKKLLSLFARWLGTKPPNSSLLFKRDTKNLNLFRQRFYLLSDVH